MKRAKRKRPEFKISLFAFLDSQLCVLGALILLLVVVSTANLRTPEPDPDAPPPPDLAAERELLELRIAQLAEQREKTQDDLRRHQLELGHLESDALKLRQQLSALANLDAEMKQHVLTAQLRSQLEFDVAHKQAEIARKRLLLDQLRRASAASANSFAVIPYQGPNGTHRQPIYIECQANAIVLQPEGVKLTEEDFEGPLGPGNPLAAAIRATREHMARQRRSSEGVTGEPYPFLLVRPDGIDAYWVAREALQSWSSDFGYELVDADWKLAYQTANADLEVQVTQAVEVAREQQRLLAQMAPRTFGGDRRVFRANPSGGGVVADRGSGRGSRGDRPGAGHGGTGFGSGRGGSNPYTEGADGGLMPEDAPLERGDATGFAGEPGSGDQYPDGDSLDGASDSYSQTGSSKSGRTGGGETGYDASQGADGVGQGRSRRGGAGRPGDTPASNQFAQRGDSASEGGQPGPAGRKDGSGSAGVNASSGSSAPGSSAGSPGSAGGAPGHPQSPAASAHASLAQKRGKNWGVPGDMRGASPVMRPVVLHCRGDAIGILSTDGRGRVETWVSFDADTEGAVDPLLEAVWKHIDNWGIAGQGLYWHPTLVLDVQPSGAGRAADLEVLLAGSGIEVRRRQASRVAAAPSSAR